MLLPAQPASASHTRIPHPSCRPLQIKLKEIFETPSEIALVLELVTGGELFDRYAVPVPAPDEGQKSRLNVHGEDEDGGG